MIKRHTCKSAYQDKKYGKGKRVWNRSGKSGTNEARCTVCGMKEQV